MNKFFNKSFFSIALSAVAIATASVPAAAEVMDDDLFLLILVDEFEYRVRDGSDLVTWEGQARIGNDDHKVALKSSGEFNLDADKLEAGEFQLLYMRPIGTFTDLQAGLRHDVKPDPDRTYAVLGANGLAPQWFEFDASAFLSSEGDVSARLEAEYDILLTQRLVLQPAAELNVALSDDKPTGVGSGISDIGLGLRLRYEVVREFAPYIGFNWERKVGRTADFAREEGEDTNDLAGVIGVRLFF